MKNKLIITYLFFDVKRLSTKHKLMTQTEHSHGFSTTKKKNVIRLWLSNEK